MRAEDKYILEPGVEQTILARLPGSPTQQVLHNLIADKIIEGQRAYDNCDSLDELRGFQAAVKALRLVSATLHKADNVGRANRTRAQRAD